MRASFNAILMSIFTSFIFADEKPYVVVLGIAQDDGSPHTDCERYCCKLMWKKGKKEKVSSIGIVDPRTRKSWIIDATPDYKYQSRTLSIEHRTELAGIFITHAHMGHYVGLLELGKEVTNTKNFPVFVMPRMKNFLENNGPWNQLVNQKNIELITLADGKEVKIGEQLFMEPFLVPHRDELSETVGYRIMSDSTSIIYIPDIDKWDKWEQSIYNVVLQTDFALLDGTFYSQNELPYRDVSEIPHPLIIESMDLFQSLNMRNRKKIYFIHLNHSNPAIKDGRAAANHIKSNGFNIAKESLKLTL